MEEIGKPKIKSTNFIWFASKRNCPSVPPVCFVAENKKNKNAMWMASTPLLKLGGVSVVPMQSAYLRNFKGLKSEQSVF